MVSEFRKKKLEHVFTVCFDTDRSGSIEKSDFDLSIERLAKDQGWSKTDDKYKLVSETLLKVWDNLQVADLDHDGKVTIEEWLSMWDAFAKNPSAPMEWQNLYAKAMFEIQDATSDGAIDCDEFVKVLTGFGHKKENVVIAFEKMAQGKSSISWSDFQELFKEHFASDDVNAPGNYIFGRLSYD